MISAYKAIYLTKAMHKHMSKAFDEVVNPPDRGSEYSVKQLGAVEDEDAIHISMVPEVLNSGEHFVVELDECHIVESATAR